MTTCLRLRRSPTGGSTCGRRGRSTPSARLASWISSISGINERPNRRSHCTGRPCRRRVPSWTHQAGAPDSLGSCRRLLRGGTVAERPSVRAAVRSVALWRAPDLFRGPPSSPAAHLDGGEPSAILYGAGTLAEG